MSLRISDINLCDFRSYENFCLGGVGDLTIFAGPNAAGKTNAIEALQLITTTSSFRNATGSELVRHGRDLARISCSVTDGCREIDLALAISEGKRTYLLNGKHRRPKDVRGILPSVTFTPDDLNLAKGSDRTRRHEIDAIGSQVNANYYQLVRDYEKMLRHKNRLLADEAPASLLDATNELFSKVGSQLTSYRRALFDRLAPGVATHYENISGAREQLTADYVASYEVSDGRTDRAEEVSSASMGEKALKGEAPSSLQDAIEACQSEERRRHRAVVGPHLDKIRLCLDGMDVTKFASQGQQRSIVLSIKLAEAEVIEEMLDQLPILLLDDVMSELDAARRAALVETLLVGKQAFITTANIDYFDAEMLARAQVISL